MLSKTTTALILSLSFLVAQNSVCAEQATKKELFTFSKATKYASADHIIRLESSFDPIFNRNGADCNSHFVIKRQEKTFNFKTHQDELCKVKSVIICTAAQNRDLRQQLNKSGPTYIKVTGQDWRCKKGLWFEVPSFDN